MSDFQRYLMAQSNTKTARAAYEAASIRLEHACMHERIAELRSQAEPLNSLGLDREKVRQVLNYVLCGRLQ